MTTKLRSVEEVATKQKQEAELAVFWDIMASALPKSIERSALGDEKIFTAFAATYPQIKAHIAAVLIEGLEGIEVGTDQRGRRWIELPDAQALIRTTLDVTSEEK